jgi:hypothetical protein
MKLNNGLRDAVHQILKNASAFEWSLQGLGMLRLYLSREVRLHVWDNRYVAGDVSVIHTHPWNFESYVVSGEVRQFRYLEDPQGTHKYKRQLIQCGPDGCAVGEPEPVRMYRSVLEIYAAGASYGQAAEEIHESLPTSGTVTVIERTFTADTEHAYVYFQGDAWGEATPRPATAEEVAAITGLALQRWGRTA